MLIIPGAHRRILKHFIAKSGTYLRSNNFANSGICYFWQFWWTLLFCQKWQFLLTPKLPKLDSEHTCYNTRRSILMKGGLNRYYSKANLLNHYANSKNVVYELQSIISLRNPRYDTGENTISLPLNILN